MKHLFYILFILLFGFNSVAQSETEMTIQLLDADLIADATLDRDEFIEWTGNTTDALDPVMKSIQGEVNVLLTFSFTKEGLIYQVAAAPALPDEKVKAIEAILNEAGTVNVRYVDYSMVIFYTINGGLEEENPQYTPAIDLPYDAKMEQFEALSFKDKVAEFEQWMKEKVIPMVATFETSVDEVFQGVISIGELMESGRYTSDPITKTSTNCDYWRGIMEMERWNQLILFSKMCMLYATGEYDRADRLLYIVSMFSDEETLAPQLFGEIADKRSYIIDEHNDMINKGIAMHDKGDYDGAIKQYQKVLDVRPKSAWATYETYFSESAKLEDIDAQVALWQDKYREMVYGCDPMYHLDIHASTGKEAYLLYRRTEAETLFKDKDKVKQDLLTYADIAFELGVYDFAGELYWLIYSHLPKDEFKKRNILASYLYCLEKLGCGQYKTNFEGEFDKEFKKIDKYHQKTMKESQWYKTMKDK